MAIAIEGYSVVGRKQRADTKYQGGLAALLAAVPNATGLTDEELWRCAFMAAADAQEFADSLEAAGLEVRQGPDPDVVIVNEFDRAITPYCEWLEIAQWDKGVIAWLSGTQPKSVIAREGWSPEKGSGLEFADHREEHLELLRREDDLEVYRDQRTGKEVFIGRTTPDPDAVFQSESGVIRDHMISPGQASLTGEARDTVRQSTAALERLTESAGKSWRLHFFIGKGKHALGDREGAYESLRTAWNLEKETELVAREFAGICLELGRADEAVRVGEQGAALLPDNPETLGNLACAHLIAGKLAPAEATIRAARRLAAEDPTNLRIQQLIEQVRSGRRPQPRTLSELTQADPPPASWWSRLKFW